MEYFSDKENGEIVQSITEVPHSFWCALVSKIKDEFTHVSEQNWEKVYDTTILDSFLSQLKGEVPKAPKTLVTENQWGGDYTPDTDVVMDIIQFLYIYISRSNINYASGGLCPDINKLFERNALAFKMLENGDIERILNPVLSETIKRTPHNSGDTDLDKYLDKAVTKFLNHDINVRRESLEALWDAFERFKTMLDPDKKQGANSLLEKASTCLNMRKEIDNESSALTSIGNNFMIRHSETSKIQISEERHVDYLFQRMYSLLWLWLESYK